jgi:hypothetical protein
MYLYRHNFIIASLGFLSKTLILAQIIGKNVDSIHNCRVLNYISKRSTTIKKEIFFIDKMLCLNVIPFCIVSENLFGTITNKDKKG